MKRLLIILLTLLLLTAEAGARLNIVNHYSPRNKERPRRARTDYIVLHTTEGPSKGSLNKLYERGEAHYMVDERGKVYRIIDRRRVALHAGRSMWCGKTGLDNYSIGVEVAGYHNKPLSKSQEKAVKELVAQLQSLYKVKDQDVVCHAMIAYGRPNRWHKKSHRGRKRCGMQFADPTLRARLGLTKKATYDPDVRAGRLVNGDDYLAKVLYGSATQRKQAVSALATNEKAGKVISKSQSAWDLARERYNSSGTTYIFPGGTKKKGSEIRNWDKIPVGTRVILGERQRENVSQGLLMLGRDGKTAMELAGDEYKSAKTFYIKPAAGRAIRGDKMKSATFKTLPAGTRVLIGYKYAGSVSKKKSAYDLCSYRWKLSNTYYLMPEGQLISGSKIKESNIATNTAVFIAE